MKSRSSSDELQGRFNCAIRMRPCGCYKLLGLAGSLVTLMTGLPVTSTISDEKSGSVCVISCSDLKLHSLSFSFKVREHSYRPSSTIAVVVRCLRRVHSSISVAPIGYTAPIRLCWCLVCEFVLTLRVMISLPEELANGTRAAACSLCAGEVLFQITSRVAM